MKDQKKIHVKRIRRKARTRSRIFGTVSRPRISVYRTNKYLYAQFIDDDAQKTLISASTRVLENLSKDSDHEALLAEKIAEKAKSAGISKGVLDRGSYKYHGRIKKFIETLRTLGITI